MLNVLQLSDAELTTFEALAKAATPGPWTWEWETGPDEGLVDTLVTTDTTVVGGAILWAKDADMRQVPLQIDQRDRRYLEALSPDVTLRLLATLQAEHARVAEQEKEVLRLRTLLKLMGRRSLTSGRDPFAVLTDTEEADYMPSLQAFYGAFGIQINVATPARNDAAEAFMPEVAAEPGASCAEPERQDSRTPGLRGKVSSAPVNEADLEAMAADLDIQGEMAAFSREEAGPTHTPAQIERLNQIRGDQANRYNDGWASPLAGKYYYAYLDIEFLLGLADPTYPARFHNDDDEMSAAPT